MSGGGSSPASTQQTTSFELPAEFRNLIFGGPTQGPGVVLGQVGAPTGLDAGIIPAARELAGQGQLAPGPVQGEVTQQAQQSMLDQASSASQIIDPIVQNFLGLQSFDTVNDPRLQGVIQGAVRPIEERFNRQTMPAISDAAMAAGQFGGTRQGVAEGVAEADALEAAGDIRSRILFSALQDDLARQERGFSQAGQILNLGLLPSQLQSQVGAQQDAFAQAEAGVPSQNLLQLAGLLQGFMPGSTQTSTVPGARGPSALQAGAGGALAGAGLGAQIGTIGGLPGAAVGGLVGGLGGLLLR